MSESLIAIEPRFRFSSGSAGAVDVARFTGVDTISTPYKFSITLISDNPDLDGDEIVNSPATFLIKRDEQMCPYSGIITSFKYIQTNVDYSTYHIVLRPSLWLLSMSVQSRIFQKMTVPDIIRKVINDSGFNISFTMDVGSYPEREYVVQFQESDLNFISRLMEECGIWYFFTEEQLSESAAQNASSTERLTITDKPSNFSDVADTSTIKFRSLSGMVNQIDTETTESIHRIQSDRRIIPVEATGKVYNYRTPEADILHTKPIPGGDAGKVYRYGGNFKDAGTAQKSVEVLAKRLLMQKMVLDGTGDCAGFRAGCRFTLEEHVRGSINSTYLITHVAHSGTNPFFQSEGSRVLYTNEFSCIPSDQANSFAPECSTPVPKIPGLTTALIESDGSEYAAVDEKGRYKVRLPFDRSGSANSSGSKYMRLAQPYSGADYGIHFPSHEGAEMIIGFVDGNPDKPLGIGTVPNGNTISPVKTATKQQGIIRTAGGNEMVFDDTDGKQKITLKTNANNRAAFDDENKRIELQTTDANGLLLDDQNKTVQLNSGDNLLTMVYESGSQGIELATIDGHKITMNDTDKHLVITTTNGHTITMDDQGKCLTITTTGGNEIEMSDAGKMLTIHTSAGNQIEMSDGGKSITITDCAGKNTITLDGKGLSLESSGEINIKAAKDLKIQAENITMKSNKKSGYEAGDQMTLKSGSAKIELKKNGDIKQNGNKIDIVASGKMKLKGSQISEN